MNYEDFTYLSKRLAQLDVLKGEIEARFREITFRTARTNKERLEASMR